MVWQPFRAREASETAGSRAINHESGKPQSFGSIMCSDADGRLKRASIAPSPDLLTSVLGLIGHLRRALTLTDRDQNSLHLPLGSQCRASPIRFLRQSDIQTSSSRWRHASITSTPLGTWRSDGSRTTRIRFA